MKGAGLEGYTRSGWVINDKAPISTENRSAGDKSSIAYRMCDDDRCVWYNCEDVEHFLVTYSSEKFRWKRQD